MALNTEGLRKTLTQKIKETLDIKIDEKSNSEEVKQKFAESIASAIADGVDIWIKTATVSVEPGITVKTAGSAAAQTGTTTSKGIGTIS